MVSEPMVCGLDEYSLIPLSKVFLTEVSRKRVPHKCMNNGTSEEFVVLVFEGECTYVEGTLT